MPLFSDCMVAAMPTPTPAVCMLYRAASSFMSMPSSRKASSSSVQESTSARISAIFMMRSFSSSGSDAFVPAAFSKTVSPFAFVEMIFAWLWAISDSPVPAEVLTSHFTYTPC